VVLDSKTELIAPNYKELISSGQLRRLSPILRMGLAAAIDCQNQVNSEFDSLVIGTALGCLKDTEKFLVTFNTSTGDFLPPTSFIQSTHNTIGGQISLHLKNRSYNMTHTQNNLSFEVSLLDAMMCIDEGKSNVLVGAADEKIPFLEEIRPELITSEYPLSSCASFFVLSHNLGKSRIGINLVGINFNVKNIDNEIMMFLEFNEIGIDELDLILHSDSSLNIVSDHSNALNYLDYSGMNYSASAFATHLAHDYLNHNDGRNVLIINNLCEGKLGLIIISKTQ
tara:strand:+ start:1237 stop:2082 length:846 start_codon:yes stop_codon:yes gene_type:complete